MISTTVRMDKMSSVVGAEAGRLVDQESAKNDGVPDRSSTGVCWSTTLRFGSVVKHRISGYITLRGSRLQTGRLQKGRGSRKVAECV